MKKPITFTLVKSYILLALLILLSVLTSNAQWTYTKSVKQTGSCIPFPLSNVNPSFNTKSECDAFRQSEINSVGDWSIFGDGSCTTLLICTPCMGSDIGTLGQGSTSDPVSFSGQVNPGDVSINGILEGKAIFTSHQSSAFEDWAQGYKQLLASYGINSILGANFKFPRTPLTDDKAFNILYITLSGNFRPMIKPALTPRNASAPKAAPVSNPPAVPSTNPPAKENNEDYYSGKVKLFTTEEELTNRDKWEKENFSFDKYGSLINNRTIDENGEQSAERSWTEAGIRTAVGQAPGLIGAIGDWKMNQTDEVIAGIKKVINAFTSGNDEKALEYADNLPSNVLVNSTKKTLANAAADKGTEIGYAPLLKLVKGAEPVYKVLKLGLDFWDNKKGE